MPGLFGIIDPSKRLGPAAIRDSLAKMEETLHHEACYTTDLHISDTFAVGRIGTHRLTSFSFPLPDPENANLLFFHGELYVCSGNDVFSAQPLEDLASDLDHDVSQALAHTDGSFALAFYNDNSRTFFIANDTISSHPVYFTHHDGLLSFAPEVKALLRLFPGSGLIDMASISHFLASGMTYLNETYFTHIKYLRPSSILSVDLCGSTVSEQPYWSFSFSEDIKDKGKDRYRDELIHLIRQAVRRRIRDRREKRIGIFLSGGFDSRGLLGACLQENADLRTITHGVDRYTPSSDALIAKELSDRLGLENRFYQLKPNRLEEHLDRMVLLTDGHTDQVANYPEGLTNYYQIRQDFDVVLRGEELFGWLGGAFSERDALACFGIIALPSRYRSILKTDSFQEMSAHCEEGLKHFTDICTLQNLIDRKDFFVFMQGMPNFWGKMNYLKSIAIDIRNPYLDKDILQFIGRLPRKYRMYRGLFRSSVSHAFPEVFDTKIATRSNMPDWEKSYEGYENLREFIATTLTRSSNRFFDLLLDREKSTAFLADYRRRVLGYEAEASALGEKAFQGSSGVDKIRRFDFRSFVSHTIRSNYHVYRLALPFFRNRRIGDKWVRDSAVILRMLVLRLWSDHFLD